MGNFRLVMFMMIFLKVAGLKLHLLSMLMQPKQSKILPTKRVLRAQANELITWLID